jgi:hypothetical protein
MALKRVVTEDYDGEDRRKTRREVVARVEKWTNNKTFVLMLGFVFTGLFALIGWVTLRLTSVDPAAQKRISSQERYDAITDHLANDEKIHADEAKDRALMRKETLDEIKAIRELLDAQDRRTSRLERRIDALTLQARSGRPESRSVAPLSGGNAKTPLAALQGASGRLEAP